MIADQVPLIVEWSIAATTVGYAKNGVVGIYAILELEAHALLSAHHFHVQQPGCVVDPCATTAKDVLARCGTLANMGDDHDGQNADGGDQHLPGFGHCAGYGRVILV